jgi:hypothetical protein
MRFWRELTGAALAALILSLPGQALAQAGLASNNFGSDVALTEGGRLIVGARGSEYGGASGTAYLMDLDGGNAMQLSPLGGTTSAMGWSIAKARTAAGEGYVIHGSGGSWLFDGNGGNGNSMVCAGVGIGYLLDADNNVSMAGSNTSTITTCNASNVTIDSSQTGMANGNYLRAANGNYRETMALMNGMIFTSSSDATITALRYDSGTTADPWKDFTFVFLPGLGTLRNMHVEGSGASARLAIAYVAGGAVLKGTSVTNIEKLSLPLTVSNLFTVSTGLQVADVAVDADSGLAALADTAGQVRVFRLPADFSDPPELIAAFDPQDYTTPVNSEPFPSVDLNASHVVVGLPKSGVGGVNAGRVYVFDLD